MDVKGLSKNGQITNELGNSSLKQAVSILTPEDFRALVDIECKLVRMTNFSSLNVRGDGIQASVLACLVNLRTV